MVDNMVDNMADNMADNIVIENENENTNTKSFYPSSCLLFKNYVHIMNEYMIFFINSLIYKLYKKNKNTIYLFLKGVDTLSHVFKLILLYTANLEAATEHTKQAIHFYIQFLEQIEENANNDLDLTANSAALFVYKKTINIFTPGMNINICKIGNNLKNLEQLIEIYRNVLEIFIKDYLDDITTVANKITEIGKELYELDMQALAAEQALVLEEETYETTYNKLLANITLFIAHLKQNAVNIKQNRYNFDFILLYLKRYYHHTLTEIHILKKRVAADYEERFINHAIQKYIKWFVSPPETGI